MPDFQIFGLERLEGRTLLAVNVSQNGGTLVITGDNFDNAVSLVDDAGGIHVFVDEDGDGTQDFDAIYYGVQNVKINLKGGDDEVFVQGIDLDRSLAINTGTGDDRVLISEVAYFNYIDGNVSITTGDGDDYVTIAGFSVEGNLTIDTGNGEDYVAVGDDALYYSEIYVFVSNNQGYVEVNGNTVIKTGNHNDTVRIQPQGADEEVEFENLTINTGAGDDEVYFGGNVDYDLHVHGDAQFVLGKGDDFFDVENDNTDYLYTQFFGNVTVDGGAGFDELTDLDEWFNNPDETFYEGVDALKLLKFEDIN